MIRFSEDSLITSYVFISEKPVLVDVGAHQGTFSRPFVNKNWQVIAFEPESNNRKVLEEKLTKFDNFTCIPKAVSDVTGEKVPFYVSEEHFGIHSLKPFHNTHKLAYEVETIRLDDVLEELNITEVTFLKIDIEGADFLALKGFDWHKYHPELIMIEFMDDRTIPNFGYTHHDVVKYMKDKGYITWVSEWAPIKEYGREGVKQEPHTWLQCVPYPLDHEPAWGNLIFVPEKDEDKFKQTLETYLNELKKPQPSPKKTPNRLFWFRNQIKKIPGAKKLYDLIKGK